MNHNCSEEILQHYKECWRLHQESSDPSTWIDIDPGLVELVTAINQLPTVATTSSCQGHPDRAGGADGYLILATTDTSVVTNLFKRVYDAPELADCVSRIRLKFDRKLVHPSTKFDDDREFNSYNAIVLSWPSLTYGKVKGVADHGALVRKLLLNAVEELLTELGVDGGVSV